MTTFQSFQASQPPVNQAPQQNLLQKAGGFIANTAKDALNTLVVTPAVRAGQAVGAGISGLMGSTSEQQQAAAAQPVNFMGMTVPGQKQMDQGGNKQIAGQALKSASYLIPGAEAEGVVGKGIVGGAIQGAKVGATSGALGGAGNSLSQGGNASDVASATAKGAGIGALAGGTLGGATGLAGNIWSKAYGSSSYDTNLANATAAQNQAGAATTNSIHEAANTMGDVSRGLGNQFAEAPSLIARADPNAGTTVTSDFMEKLNSIKESKTFVLPESLKEITPDIKKGTYKLNPQQTQDLLTQLNELTYKAKASGDLAINQQSVGLTQELKNAAQEGMGHVTDAQGNSVWNSAYQDYRQGKDAMDSMSNLIPIKKSPGEILDPVEVNNSVNKMMKMMETPQGTQALIRANTEFKAATGYDLLNDPMGTISKLADSNKDFAQALKGGYGHQFIQGFKNPRLLNRRIIGVGFSILGIAALSTAFRKQIGGFISGQ